MSIPPGSAAFSIPTCLTKQSKAAQLQPIIRNDGLCSTTAVLGVDGNGGQCRRRYNIILLNFFLPAELNSATITGAELRLVATGIEGGGIHAALYGLGTIGATESEVVDQQSTLDFYVGINDPRPEVELISEDFVKPFQLSEGETHSYSSANLLAYLNKQANLGNVAQYVTLRVTGADYFGCDLSACTSGCHLRRFEILASSVWLTIAALIPPPPSPMPPLLPPTPPPSPQSLLPLPLPPPAPPPQPQPQPLPPSPQPSSPVATTIVSSHPTFPPPPVLPPASLPPASPLQALPTPASPLPASPLLSVPSPASSPPPLACDSVYIETPAFSLTSGLYLPTGEIYCGRAVYKTSSGALLRFESVAKGAQAAINWMSGKAGWVIKANGKFRFARKTNKELLDVSTDGPWKAKNGAGLPVSNFVCNIAS